jgi:hypothetical protein
MTFPSVALALLAIWLVAVVALGVTKIVLHG